MPTKQGFVLLFAVLVTSIVMAISLGIFSLIIKELKLSGASRESQRAFYAADAGTECAFYWDIHERLFSTTTSNLIQCAGDSMSVGGGFVSDFVLTFDNGTCVDVRVDKTNESQTVVTSRGHNTCDTNDLILVERALQVTY